MIFTRCLFIILSISLYGCAGFSGTDNATTGGATGTGLPTSARPASKLQSAFFEKRFESVAEGVAAISENALKIPGSTDVLIMHVTHIAEKPVSNDDSSTDKKESRGPGERVFVLPKDDTVAVTVAAAVGDASFSRLRTLESTIIKLSGSPGGRYVVHGTPGDKNPESRILDLIARRTIRGQATEPGIYDNNRPDSADPNRADRRSNEGRANKGAFDANGGVF